MDGYRNNSVGFVFQEYNLLDNYTAGVNVALALELQGKKATRDEVDAILRELDLVNDDGTTLYDRHINELSGGQKQRIAIARALIKDPKIILADEPTGALDSDTGAELYELFKRLSASRLIIVVSHDVESAKKYGDRIIELKDGAVIADTSCAEEEKAQVLVPAYCSAAPGKLPVKRTISMGLAGLRCKPFRLIISVILAVISFTFACFSMVSATTDVMAAELRMSYKNGVKTAVLVADSVMHTYHKYANGTTEEYTTNYGPALMDEQIKRLSEMDDCVVMTVVPSFDLPDRMGANNLGHMSAQERYNPYNNLAAGGFQRVIELDPETGEEDACLTPDPRLTVECRLPQNLNEIAITDYWADMYMRFGFVDEDGITREIKSPDELIGKTIDGAFTICGIYCTEEDKEELKLYDRDEQVYEYVTNDYARYLLGGEHPMGYAFVREGYCAEFCPQGVTYARLYQLSGSISKDKKLIEEISYSYYVEWLPEENLGHYFQFKYSPSATYRTRYAGFAEASEFFRDESFLTGATVISVCFAIFSALLLMSFLSANMEARKHELGILRALGARTFDVVKICMTESFAIACIDFILTLILTGIACLILNIKYYLWLFVIGIIPLASLILLCFGVAALATIIPALRLAKKKPVDVIRGK